MFLRCLFICFVLAVRTLVIALGFITVPIAAAFERYYWTHDIHKQVKGEFPYVAHFTQKWMKPWDNPEDGIANAMYWRAPNVFLQILYWSCIRNPANGLRQIKPFYLKIDPEKVEFIGTKGLKLSDYDRDDVEFWYFCWQGLYSNFRVHFKLMGKMFRFWIGFKIYPGDINGVAGHRAKYGAGFATQLKVIG